MKCHVSRHGHKKLINPWNAHNCKYRSNLHYLHGTAEREYASAVVKVACLHLGNVTCDCMKTYKMKTREFGLFYVLCRACPQHTPTKKVLGHLWPPLLRPFLWSFYNETLSVSPCVLTSGVSFVSKGISRIANFNNWQWFWKYLIIHIRSFKNELRCNTLSTKLVFFIPNSGSCKLKCRQ